MRSGAEAFIRYATPAGLAVTAAQNAGKIAGATKTIAKTAAKAPVAAAKAVASAASSVWHSARRGTPVTKFQDHAGPTDDPSVL